MVTNQELETAGLNETERNLYYNYKTAAKIVSKYHTERSEIKTTLSLALTDLQTIIGTQNPTTNAQIVWAIKRLAEIELAHLKYHQAEIG